MLKSIQQRDLERNRWVKIGMSVLLGVICLSMLTYLIPGMGSAAFTNAPDSVATVGGQSITATDVQRQLNTALHGQSVPDVLKGLYAKAGFGSDDSEAGAHAGSAAPGHSRH